MLSHPGASPGITADRRSIPGRSNRPRLPPADTRRDRRAALPAPRRSSQHTKYAERTRVRARRLRTRPGRGRPVADTIPAVHRPFSLLRDRSNHDDALTDGSRPGTAAAPADITALITWFVLTARRDLAPPPER
jgi:hypothetical protein